jgi:hypothetical protein
MRAGACTILCVGAILIAAPAWAAGGRYDPDYPLLHGGNQLGRHPHRLHVHVNRAMQARDFRFVRDLL